MTSLTPRQPAADAADPASIAAPVVEARNVHRILGGDQSPALVLRGVDLSIRRGNYVSIVGPSGSGKSTLLYLLGGLDRPSPRDMDDRLIQPASRVLIDGRDTRDLSDAALARLRNHLVGFVFQFHYLLRDFTAQENVALPMLKLGRLSRAQAMDRAAGLLADLGLQDKARRRANRLSGGEQQRVAVARALANEPAVLLADEPTGNLDRRNSELVADVFDRLAADGQTIVIVTHDQHLAHRAQRLLSMEDGRIIEDRDRRTT